MIYNNDLLLFLLEHNHNVFFDSNICSIQELIHSENPAGPNFKRLCLDFLNLAILTNIVTLGEIQVIYGTTSIGNKPLMETITALALTGFIEDLSVILVNAEHAFTSAGGNIRLLITEILLHATSRKLSRSKKIHNWSVLNDVLLPPLLTNTLVLKVQAQSSDLPKTFAAKRLERGSKSTAKDSGRKKESDSEEDKDVDTKRKSANRYTTDTGF